MADTPGTAAGAGTGALYNPEEAGKKLVELDALVPQVSAALHQEKFQQVQVSPSVVVLFCVGGWG